MPCRTEPSEKKAFARRPLELLGLEEECGQGFGYRYARLVEIQTPELYGKYA